MCETNDATKYINTHDPHLNPKRRRIATSFTVSYQTLTMANSLEQTRPWFLYAVPLLVFLLIAFHVLALVYWIYRLSTDTKPQQQTLQQQLQQQQQQRRKAHWTERFQFVYYVRSLDIYSKASVHIVEPDQYFGILFWCGIHESVRHIIQRVCFEIGNWATSDEWGYTTCTVVVSFRNQTPIVVLISVILVFWMVWFICHSISKGNPILWFREPV